MSTTPNPLVSQVPGMTNPTGVQVSGPLAAGSTYVNPYLTGSSLGSVPGSASPAPTSSDTSTTSSTGTLGATSAPPLATAPGSGPLGVTIGQTSPLNTSINPADNAALLKNLQKMYGKGVGSTLYQFLVSGAGYNPNVVQAEIQQMQPQIETGLQDLQEQFAVAGGSGSSSAGIGEADYLSQVTADENALFAQQYEQAIQNYMNVLLPTSKTAAAYQASTPSTLDEILGGLSLASVVAGIF